MNLKQKEKTKMKNRCENCGECCLKTEMILSKNNVEKIMKNSPKKLQKKDFVLVNKEGFFQLKNIRDHCVFFDSPSKLCKIYDYRPQGCEFYPLIYNIQNNNCIFDRDCPRTNLFYQDKERLRKMCNNLKDFLKESFKMKLK